MHAKLLGHGNEVRLVRLEKAQHRAEECRIGEPLTKLVGPDSGQVEESLRPTFGAERCSKRSEGEGDGILRGIIWYPGCHGLELCKSG